ncbi:tol-pal system-associated acyl-CoA thioesterase [Orrella marina]|uniref:Tol-pal system-associated acyl-CoA thioesterase n=1 Tax=Orrella marina TaxID=2163011 RepID=A0A2R4XKH8_9BURK|nr:tol-pal system-associated acyl-CoA thioesterase [Orrella marina]AWB34296.1 tol-pal system-associated acyl-CoA thioesterase [Orrella marina]
MHDKSNRTALVDSPWDDFHGWSVRVYYEDTDAGGVVFYANYLKFMERARTEWLRSLGVSQQELSKQKGLVFVVSSLSMEYKAPARLDDLLTIQSVISDIRRASLNFTQRITLQDKVLARGQIRVGCVDINTMRPAAIPPDLYKRISSTSQR